MVSAPHTEFDFAVIGGGLVGAAIAWGLARRRRSVAMLDEGDIAFRASRGNFALIWVQSKGGGMSRYALWTRQSSDAWPQLAEALRIETGLDVCLHQPGGFHLLLSPEEVENRANAPRVKAIVDAFKDFDVIVHWVAPCLVSWPKSRQYNSTGARIRDPRAR